MGGGAAAISLSTSSSSSSVLKASKLGGISSKIAPMHSLKAPINMAASGNTKKPLESSCAMASTMGGSRVTNGRNSASSAGKSLPSATTSVAASSNGLSAHHRGLILLSKSSADERADNRKNENAEKKKRDDKIKLKAEKDARKVIHICLSYPDSMQTFLFLLTGRKTHGQRGRTSGKNAGKGREKEGKTRSERNVTGRWQKKIIL